MGMMETKTRMSRPNAKKKIKSSKQAQRHVFNDACIRSALYKDYFSPDSEAEKTMLGLKKLVGADFSLLATGFYRRPVIDISDALGPER